MYRCSSIFDALIIGGGPAGLSTALALAGSGLKILLLDEGQPCEKRDRNSYVDIPSGIGGAGLFSDGKFSFYPSASQLWRLPPSSQLKRAYTAVCSYLARHDMITPDFPESPNVIDAATEARWSLKSYPSKFMSFKDRLRLVQNIVKEVECDVRTCSQAIHVSRLLPSSFEVAIKGARGIEYAVTTRALVLGTGRFGPLEPGFNFYPTVFRRLEFGVRIQQPKSSAFFDSLPNTDPKLKSIDALDATEWRTFCACRDGETVTTRTSEFWSVSGRADGARTGYSNIGFNVRLLDSALAEQLLPTLLDQLRNSDVLFRVPLDEFLVSPTENRITSCFGVVLTEMLCHGLTRLRNSYPSVGGDAILVGPTLEGIGHYPAVEPDLRLPNMPCWVAGDAAGIFRGLIAAMVSGYYAGLAVRSYLSA